MHPLSERVLINIMLEFLDRNPSASFGYIGANSIAGNFEEPKSSTQRFRIYEYAMNNFFSIKSFERIYYRPRSAVFMLNLRHQDPEQLRVDATNMFTEIYPELEAQLPQ